MIDVQGLLFWATVGGIIGFLVKMVTGRGSAALISVLPFFIALYTVMTRGTPLSELAVEIPLSEIGFNIPNLVIDMVSLISFISITAGNVVGIFIAERFRRPE